MRVHLGKTLAIACLVAAITPATSLAASSRPDLYVKTVAKPASSAVVAGQSLALKVTVANRGRAKAAKASVSIALRGSVKLATANVTTLKAGRRTTPTIKVKTSPKLKPGRYRLTICADAGKRVRESNERNNCLTPTWTLQVKTPVVTPPATPATPVGATPPPVPVPAPTTLTVAVFHQDDTASDGKGGPAANARVRFAGKTLGTTGEDGRLTATVTPGTGELSATLASLGRVTTGVTAVESASTSAEVILNEGGESATGVDVSSPDVVDGVLSVDFKTLRLQLSADGEDVQLATLEAADLSAPVGGAAPNPNATPQDVAKLFAVQPDGSIAVTDADAFGEYLGGDGRYFLDVGGVDADGYSYDGRLEFIVGRYKMRVKVLAPPSAPTFSTAGIDLELTLDAAGITRHVTTGADGTVQLPGLVPGGVWAFASDVLRDGTHYYAQGQAVINAALEVNLTARAVADVIANVAPISTKPLASPAALTSLRPQGRLGVRTAAPAAPVPAETVTVTAAGQNQVVSATKSVTVPKGTSSVSLKYSVSTIEYPYYVLRQSIFNDVWSLNVYGGTSGMLLATYSRDVNSQLYVPPTWQGDGSTGDIERKLDVSALTKDTDATLTLSATAMNVGDNRLPTTVNATISDATLKIESMTADAVTPTNGDSSYYSIPRPGANNTAQRKYRIKYTAPAGTDITNVTVRLNAGTSVQTLVDEAVGGGHVTRVSDDTLDVRVTYDGLGSTIASTPPPSDAITYEFALKGSKDSVESQDTKSTPVRHGLWRMPDGIARYGLRDAGFDDWSSLDVYTWLVAHSGLVTRVDDISGEHGINIGHDSHATGHDMDWFHAYTFPGGAVSGTTNYLQLEADAKAAFRGDAASLARVTAWVTATRAKLDAVIAAGRVTLIISALGSPLSAATTPTAPALAVPSGWAQSLLTGGTATATGGAVLNTGLGAWGNGTNAVLRFRSDHNNHIHIRIAG